MILTALILFLSVWAASSTRELKKEEVELRLLSSPDFKSQFLLGLGARTVSAGRFYSLCATFTS
jgi:hypothetical protein